MLRTVRMAKSCRLSYLAVGSVLAVLLVSACSAASQPTATSSPGKTHHEPQNSAGLTISPANGSRNVAPGEGITVTATHGRISSVSASAGGQPVAGTLNAAATTWHSTWALPVSTDLKVTATAKGSDGKLTTATSSFRTLTPKATFQTMIFEGYRQTYGVGMPIMLTFSQPVTNKAAVESALQLRTSKPVVGSWYWDGNKTLDFRPRDYWPPNTTVSFTGHLNGVEASPGVYGFHTLTQTFVIGDSLIVVASTASHYLRLYRNGKLYARWPISTGKPGDNTPNGTYLTIDKGNPVLMKGPGYALEVPWSVRFTWTGDYLHDAYWSVSEQGFTNVSHGCVNMRPADAEIYYKMEVPGDPVTVIGSPQAGAWDNGWTEWFLSWQQYLKGSALHEAVEAGPAGSTFVSPSALPPDTATAPLGLPAPNDSLATS